MSGCDEKIVLDWGILRKNIPAISAVFLLLAIIMCIVDENMLTLPNLILCVFLSVASVLDIKYMLLFNKITYSMMGTGLVIGLIKMIQMKDENMLLEPLSYTIVCSGILAVISMCYSGGLGGGDIKFAGAIGSWLADERGILALLISFWLGALFAGVYLMFHPKANKNMKIPFGPFLAIGTFSALVFGRCIIGWYWSG